MKNTIFATLLVGAFAFAGTAMANSGGEGEHTHCNGQGNPNSPCEGGGGHGFGFDFDFNFDVDFGFDADYGVLQLNIKSPTTARATVNGVTVSGTRRTTVDLTVEAVAIGNIADVTTTDVSQSRETVGSAQVNYRSATTARAVVRNSNIDFSTVEVTVTAEAFGNVLNVGDADKVEALQVNKLSGTTAVAVLENINMRRRPRGPGQDPIVTATAVGNSMYFGDQIKETSTLQLNYRSPTTATARISRVRGNLGPTTVSATAIGNSLSVNGTNLN